MGLRVRLKRSFDVSGFPKQARVVLVALKRYGMILADNGSPWFVTGAPDQRWNDDALHAITRVTGADLEVVEHRSRQLARVARPLRAEPDRGHCISATCAPRCWPGSSPAAPDRSSSCAWRTSTRGACGPEHEAGQLADLSALGLDWDGAVVRQSERA